MAITAALIAGGLTAAGGIASSAIQAGSRGAGQRTDLYDQQLADARQNAINAAIQNAQIGKLGRAGFSDSQGSSLVYDPATNQWVQQLGPGPQAAQTAADQASILRNTTDVRQAQGANARADINAARAQPLIDAARRRYEQFQPMTGDELTSLLTERAATANTEAYRPIIQDTLRQFTRSGTAAGDVMSRIGRESAASLQKGMIDARLQGITGADNINNTRRQGLAGDLTTAMAAGTPQFQYPGIAPRTDNKDMLAALTSRANNAGVTAAYGLNATAAANKGQADAVGNLAGSIPLTDSRAAALAALGSQLGDVFKDKNVQKGLADWFGSDSTSQAKNDLINS